MPKKKSSAGNEQPFLGGRQNCFVPLELQCGLDHIVKTCPGSIIHINYDGVPQHLWVEITVPLTQGQYAEYVEAMRTMLAAATSKV